MSRRYVVINGGIKAHQGFTVIVLIVFEKYAQCNTSPSCGIPKKKKKKLFYPLISHICWPRYDRLDLEIEDNTLAGSMSQRAILSVKAESQ